MAKPHPIDLGRTPVHLDAAAGALVLQSFDFTGEAFEAYITEHCSDANPGRLVMIESSSENWPSWEMHPQGDELVIILSGAGDFIQQQGDTQVRMSVGPGDTILNPAGVWHTADIREPIRAVYITPCPGTAHKPRD